MRPSYRPPQNRAFGAVAPGFRRRRRPLPVAFHSDDDPARLRRLVVELLGESADLGVGQAPRPARRRIRGRRRRAEGSYPAGRPRPPSYIPASAGRRSNCRRQTADGVPITRWMPSGLPALLSLRRTRGLLDEDRAARRVILIANASGGSDDLLGRDAVDALRIDADEVLPAAGHDVGLEAVGPQMGHEFDLRQVGKVGVEAVPPRMPRRSEPARDLV